MRHSLTHLDMLNLEVVDWHSLATEMEVRDDGAVGPQWLGYYQYKHQTAFPTANVTGTTRTSPAPA